MSFPGLIKCACPECSCEEAAPKAETGLDPICYFCRLKEHRTRRVKTIERELFKARDQIAKLEQMKSIEWKN